MNARHALQNLNAPALYQQVAEQLRARIFAHELAPGAWIDEQALALQYGISRTPMREALKVLASEGLVILKPRRGCYVAEISEQDLDEVFAVMAALESMVAEEATRRVATADFLRLKAIHDELEQQALANDIDRYFAANQNFHSALQEIAGNRYLSQLIDDTRKVIKLTRRDSLLAAGRVIQSLEEHRGILAAIEAGNAELAGQRMHAHLLAGRQAIAKLQTAATNP
jgi:DNA-binding GntR family transcriptional regulator